MSDSRQTQLLGILLWAQCLFLGSTFRTLPWMSGFAGIITIAVLLKTYYRSTYPIPQSIKTRWWVAPLAGLSFLVLCGLIAPWRAYNRLSEEINFVYLAIDTLAHASMTFSLLLWFRRPSTGHPSMIPLGFVVTLMSCAAGGASSSLTAQTAIALTICIGFVTGCEIILKHQHGFGTNLPNKRRSLSSSIWLAPIFSLLVLSVLLMSTSGIANGTSMILPTIQSILQEELNTSFNAMAEKSYVGGTRYVRGSELGSLRRYMLGDPTEVAVQAYCQITPGYLRGSVFDQYFRGRWIDSGSFAYQRYARAPRVPDRLVTSDSLGTTELNVPISQPLNRFELVETPPNKIIPIEVLSDPSKGAIIFTPLNSLWIEARGKELSYTPHGIIRSGIDVRRPYVAGVGQQLPPSSLSENMNAFTLQVPSRLDQTLWDYGTSIIGQANTSTDIAEAISEHFQSEYGYSLTTNIDRPKSEDPIRFFLENRHDAHCEYFASATVMLLRRLGVRARYVTGYILDEASDEDADLWLGRNRDAHAWAEAYDEQAQRWFPVESTPGLKYKTIEPEQADLLAAAAAGVTPEDLAGGDDSLFETIVGWVTSIRVSEPIVILFRISQLPLFVILVLFLWKRHRRTISTPDAKEEQRCRRMLRRVDRIMQRMSLIRSPSETLWQFADRIHRTACEPERSSGQKKTLQQCSEWYRDYAAHRYQGLIPQPLAL